MDFLLNIIANISLFNARTSANSHCVIALHEPEMPDAVKKLIKY